VRKRTFEDAEIQKLALFGYVLLGVVLGETVGNPGTKSPVFSSEGSDNIFGSKEFQRLKNEIDAYNVIQERFGGETDSAVDIKNKMLNNTLKNISEQMIIVENKK